MKSNPDLYNIYFKFPFFIKHKSDILKGILLSSQSTLILSL